MPRGAAKGLAAARSPSYKHREPQSFCWIFRRIPMRPSRRAPDELRAVSLERGVVKYAEGSCMVKFGDTHVLVTATLEERPRPWPFSHGGSRSSRVAVTSTWVSPNLTMQEPSAYLTTPRSSDTARSSSGARRLGRMGILRNSAKSKKKD